MNKIDDTISRKAAIAVLRAMQTYKLFAGDDMLLIDQAGAQTELMMLPPAPLGANLAEAGTDCISRAKAIETLEKDMASLDHIINGMSANDVRFDAYVSQRNQVNYDIYAIKQLPPAQPEIIRCRECKFASGDSRICMKFDHSPIGELDFCAWAERRTDE